LTRQVRLQPFKPIDELIRLVDQIAERVRGRIIATSNCKL